MGNHWLITEQLCEMKISALCLVHCFWVKSVLFICLNKKHFKNAKKSVFLSVQGVSDPVIRKRNRLHEVRFAKYWREINQFALCNNVKIENFEMFDFRSVPRHVLSLTLQSRPFQNFQFSHYVQRANWLISLQYFANRTSSSLFFTSLFREFSEWEFSNETQTWGS